MVMVSIVDIQAAVMIVTGVVVVMAVVMVK